MTLNKWEIKSGDPEKSKFNKMELNGLYRDHPPEQAISNPASFGVNKKGWMLNFAEFWESFVLNFDICK